MTAPARWSDEDAAAWARRELNGEQAGPPIPAADAPRPPTPALDAWQRRVNAGTIGEDPARPGTWHMDALYWAACAEQSALNAWAGGCRPEVIASDLERAERTLRRAPAA